MKRVTLYVAPEDILRRLVLLLEALAGRGTRLKSSRLMRRCAEAKAMRGGERGLWR